MNRSCIPLLKGIVILLLSVKSVAYVSAQDMYFGLTPPGAAPQPFAPEAIITESRYNQNSTFTPTGDEFCFGVTNSSWSSCKIWYTKQVDGVWQQAQQAPFISTDGWDPFFSSDGNYLFYIRWRTPNICRLEKVNGEWTNRAVLDAPVWSSEGEWSPSVSANGTIYFYSNRSSGAGIYKAVEVDGTYPTVEKLPSPINDYNDAEPFIAPDESYLIFSTNNRRGRVGQDDLFISFRTGENWSEPVSLGAPINSSEIEFSPCVSPDGRFLFFSRRKAWSTTIPSQIYWVNTSCIDSLKQITASVPKGTNQFPQQWTLYQNYPNPFNPATILSYELSEPCNVSLKVTDVNGKIVWELEKHHELPGQHQVLFDGSKLPSGLYLYNLDIGNQRQCRKMMLIQ